MNDCNPIPCDCIDGPQGADGLQGAQGDDGVQGILGTQGDVGDQGDQGDKGAKGLIGDQGNTGNPTTGGVGDTGPQGPDGDDGDDGDTGAQGGVGAPGVDGLDNYCGIHSAFYDTGGYAEIAGTPVPYGVQGGTSSPCPNGGVRFFHWEGEGGWKMFVHEPAAEALGEAFRFFGLIGIISWSFGVKAPATVEMAAFDSTTDNISSSGGPALISPYFAYGQRQMTFDALNGSDCVTVLHTGNQEWVVIEGNFADETFPSFT